MSNTYSKAPSYQDGLKAISTVNTHLLDVISGDQEGTVYGGKKFGLGCSIEQELTNEIGLFSRVGWNDGKYATWAFTEIDQSFSLGLSVKGNKWNRPDCKLPHNSLNQKLTKMLTLNEQYEKDTIHRNTNCKGYSRT